MQLLDDQGEAAVGAVHAEEDHGHVLRRAAGGPGALGGAVVRVALVERQRMVLPAGELLALQDPAVKYLAEEDTPAFRFGDELSRLGGHSEHAPIMVGTTAILCGFASGSSLSHKDL